MLEGLCPEARARRPGTEGWGQGQEVKARRTGLGGWGRMPEPACQSQEARAGGQNQEARPRRPGARGQIAGASAWMLVP